MELEGIYTNLSTTASLCKPPVLLCSFKYEMTPPQRVKFQRLVNTDGFTWESGNFRRYSGILFVF